MNTHVRSLPRRRKRLKVSASQIGALVGGVGGTALGSVLAETYGGLGGGTLGALAGWFAGFGIESIGAARGVRSDLIEPTTLAAVPSEASDFFGRQTLVNELLTFLKRREGGLFLLRGVGGCGKSATLLRTLESLAADEEFSKQRVHGPVVWSFYLESDQGSFFRQLAETMRPILNDDQRERVFSLDGGVNPIGLQAVFQQLDRPFLLVLDGLERVQLEECEGGRAAGDIAYHALRSLLLSASRGEVGGLKIVVTSRLDIPRLGAPNDQLFFLRALDRFPEDEAIGFMRKHGVKGDDNEIKSACDEYRYHVYSMKLLAAGLNDQFGGDIRRRDIVPDTEYDEDRRIWRILRWYKNAVLEPEHLRLMEGLSFYRAGVDVSLVAPVLTAMARARGEPDNPVQLAVVRAQISRLSALSLVFTEAAVGVVREIDLHPLVRDFFYASALGSDRLGDAAVEVHRELSKRLADSVPGYNPQNRDEVNLLVETIHHLLRAKDFRSAYEIYQARLQAYKQIGLHMGDHALGAGVIFLFQDSAFLLDKSVPEDWKNRLITDGALYYKNLGRLEDAIDLLSARINSIKAEDADASLVIMIHNLSGIQLLCGRTGEAIVSGSIASERLKDIRASLSAVTASRLDKECRSRVAGARAVRGELSVLDEYQALREIVDDPAEPPRESPAIRHAWLLSLLGRHDEALLVTEAAIAFSTSVGAEMIRQRLLATRASVLINARRVDEAAHIIAEIAHWSTGGDIHMLIVHHLAQARLLAARELRENALEAARAGARIASTNGFSVDWNDLKLIEAETLFALGRLDDADAACKAVLALGDPEGVNILPAGDTQLHYAWATASALYCQARIALARPDGREAGRALLERAVVALEALGHFDAAGAAARLAQIVI